MKSTKPDIKLAVMSLMWNCPIERFMEDAAAAGYEGIATFSDTLVEMAGDAMLDRGLKDLELKVVSVDLVIPPAGPEPRTVREVCRAMERLGAPYLVVLGGRKGDDIPRFASVLDRIGEISQSFGVRTVYHNHTSYTGETFEETGQLLERTDPAKVGGFLDVGHATKDFIEHPTAERAVLFLEKYWDRIEFLEFKDWSEQYDLCTEVGAGRTDYARIFRLLREKNYQGWITVEQNGPMGDKTPLQCARSSLQFIRKGLGL